MIRKQGAACPGCAGDFLPTPEKVAALLDEIPIPESLAAEKTLYEMRLAVCAACPSLSQQVLCSHCGCFVMFRARAKKGYCPYPGEDKWLETGRAGFLGNLT